MFIRFSIEKFLSTYEELLACDPEMLFSKKADQFLKTTLEWNANFTVNELKGLKRNIEARRHIWKYSTPSHNGEFCGNAKSSILRLKHEVINGAFTGKIISEKIKPQRIQLSVSDCRMETIERMMDDIEEGSLEGADQIHTIPNWMTDDDDWFSFT